MNEIDDVRTDANTGAAFPEELDPEDAHPLGGTIELRKRPHPVFTIRLPGGIAREEPDAVG